MAIFSKLPCHCQSYCYLTNNQAGNHTALNCQFRTWEAKNISIPYQGENCAWVVSCRKVFMHYGNSYLQSFIYLEKYFMYYNVNIHMIHLFGSLSLFKCIAANFLKVSLSVSNPQRTLKNLQYYLCSVITEIMHALVLPQPRTPLALVASRAPRWLRSDLVSTGTPSSFTEELLCSGVPLYALVNRAAGPHVQDSAAFVELHEVPLSPLLQPSSTMKYEITTLPCNHLVALDLVD